MYAPMILAVLLGAGMSTSGAPPTSVPFMLGGVERAVATTSAYASIHPDFDGTVAGLEWTQVTPGIDGVGGGNDVFTVAITVAGSTVCSFTVACDAVRGDYTTTCSATFTSGQDFDLRTTTAPCLTPPTGFPVAQGTKD